MLLFEWVRLSGTELRSVHGAVVVSTAATDLKT
jgi:hypothetical protein